MTLKNARRFFPVVTGNTVGSHKQIVDQLKKKGVKDVQKIEDCDFTLAFCPVVSRLGTDIEAAMQVIPVDKPVILVVLHHTFDEDAIVPESSRLVTRSDVVLTVDFLFFETRGLLRCNKNDISLQRICDELKLTKSILPGPRTGGEPPLNPPTTFSRWIREFRFVNFCIHHGTNPKTLIACGILGLLFWYSNRNPLTAAIGWWSGSMKGNSEHKTAKP